MHPNVPSLLLEKLEHPFQVAGPVPEIMQPGDQRRPPRSITAQDKGFNQSSLCLGKARKMESSQRREQTSKKPESSHPPSFEFESQVPPSKTNAANTSNNEPPHSITAQDKTNMGPSSRRLVSVLPCAERGEARKWYCSRAVIAVSRIEPFSACSKS